MKRMIGNIMLALFLIAWGLNLCLSLAIPPVYLGLFAVLTGLLILVQR